MKQFILRFVPNFTKYTETTINFIKIFFLWHIYRKKKITFQMSIHPMDNLLV